MSSNLDFEIMALLNQREQYPIDNLRKTWVLVALLSMLILLCGLFLFWILWQPIYAVRWLLYALGGFAYLLWVLWSNLTANHRVGEMKLLPSFGAGNLLTIFRGALIALLLGFLTSPRPEGWLAWAPGMLYTLAATVDLFDGYFARKSNHATRLGEILDLKLDGLGVLIAVLLALGYGQVPAWYLLVGLAHYLFIAGIWLRERLGKPVYELPESPGRRPFAGAQMGFLAVILWPLFSPPGTHLVAALFAIPFLVGFGWDWLVVSGAIKPLISHREIRRDQAEDHTLAQRRHMISCLLPLLLRAAVVSLATLTLIQRFTNVLGLLNNSEIPSGFVPAGFSVLIMLFLLTIGTILLALGAAGRFATLAILFSIGLHQHISSLTTLDILIIIGAGAVFFLGTGAYSLWKPEDKLIQRRLGEV